MRCPKCNSKITREDIFCENCGCKIEKKSKKVYVTILCMLFLICCCAVGVYVMKKKATNSVKREIESTEKRIENEQEDDEQENEKMVEKQPENEDKVEEKTVEVIETAPNDAAVLDGMDVEAEVLKIRSIYNQIQTDVGNYNSRIVDGDIGTKYSSPDNVYAKYVIKKGENGVDFSREYYCVNNQLIFAFYYQGTKEERFYFYDGIMFRWIDENKNVYDKMLDNAEWKRWKEIIEKETTLLLIGYKE